MGSRPDCFLNFQKVLKSETDVSFLVWDSWIQATHSNHLAISHIIYIYIELS